MTEYRTLCISNWKILDHPISFPAQSTTRRTAGGTMTPEEIRKLEADIKWVDVEHRQTGMHRIILTEMRRQVE